MNFFGIYSPTTTNFFLGSGTTKNDQIATGKAALLGTDHVLNHSIYGISPRLGMAWDVRGTGTTSVAGFGLFADQPPYTRITDLISQNLHNDFTPYMNVRSGRPTPVFQSCSAPTDCNQVCPIVDTSNIVLNASGGVTGQRANVNGYSQDYKLTRVEVSGIDTFGKALDETSQSGSLDSGSITTITPIIHAQNLRAQPSRADISIHHQFSADGTYTIPPLLWKLCQAQYAG